MRLRRTLAAASTLAAVVAMAGCGDDASSSDADGGAASSISSDAAPEGDEATGDDESAEDESAEDESADDDAGDSSDDSASDSGGALDERNLVSAMKAGMQGVTTVHVDMAVSGAGAMKATADMDLSEGDPALEMTMNGAAFNGKARLILVDDTMYISLPSVPGGKFIAVDNNTGDPSLRSSMDSLADSASPESQFESWDSSLTDVEYIGPDTVKGEETEHYRISVDSKKALKAQDQQIPAGLPKTLTYDVWLDADDRMREVSFELLETTTTMYATDWGEPVDVSAPSPSQIIRMP
jgi:hypothetical protein